MKTIRGILASSHLVAMAGLLAPSVANAQRDTTVVADARYAKSAVHRFFFGSGYRDLWTVPTQAPILDVRTFAGGLTPLSVGGGFQTLSLYFRGADGNRYGFRGVVKQPGVLPVEIESTFVKDVVQDGISAGHPGAPAVTAPLLEAVGVLGSNQTLVILPQSLDSFCTEFCGELGFLERHIAEPGRPSIAGADLISSSRRLFPLLRRSPANLIDQRALLTARLMDVYFGDWDRHRGQWTWARMGTSRPARWIPIPEDRDQAFVRFDGLLLSIARTTGAPFLVKFSEDYSSIVGETWNGRDVDRWFMGGLGRPVWDSTALFLQARLTDSVIDAAVRRLPDAWYALNGAELATVLKHRRDNLPREAARYYRLLADQAEIHGTAAAEQVVIERQADGMLAVRMSAPGASTSWFDRTYDPRDTREVRVFLRGGADRIVVRGDGPADITVHLVPKCWCTVTAPGSWRDWTDSVAVVTDSSRAGGVKIHDPAWRAPRARSVVRISGLPQRPGAERDEPTPPRDWGSRNTPVAQVALGPDIGLFLGYGVTHTSYGFRRPPFASQWRFSGGWATAPVTGRLALSGTIHPERSRMAVELNAYASGLEVVRWNGFGNATAITQPKSYYYVDQRQVGLEARLAFRVGADGVFRVGPALRFSRTLEQAGRVIADSLPYGAGSFGQAGLKASLDLDRRDNPGATTRGFTLSLGGSAYPAVWGVDSAFGEVHAVGATYLTARLGSVHPTLALRAGAKHVSGHVPFHEAAYIGDGATVRLGGQNRYGGDNAAWANAELRLPLTHFFVILPGRFGIFGLADVGRVAIAGESSEQWHSAVGGGIWISLLQPSNLFSVAVAQSRERTALYFGAGFAY